MNKIIVFGSTGMLGRYVEDYLSKFFTVFCVNRDQFDVEKDDFSKLQKIADSYEISSHDVLINCIGLMPHRFNKHSLSKDGYDDEAYRRFILVNSIFPHQLEKLHLTTNCDVISITSDCVFTGDKGGYNENDTPDYQWAYGVTKSIGECSEICTIRSSIIGEEKLNKQAMLEWVVSQKGKSINGFDNYLWNGLTCLQTAKVMKHMIEKNLYWKGVRHILSPEVVSKYDMCCMINEIYDLGINVNKTSLESKIDRSLTSLHDDFMEIPDIKTQIQETKNYTFKYDQ